MAEPQDVSFMDPELRKFQWQYLYVWLLVIVGLIVAVGAFFLLTVHELKEVDPILLRLLAVIGGYVLLASCILGGLTLAMTRQVAGAAWRLTECMEKLTGGDIDHTFHLKKGDYLQNLADGLNEVRRALKRRKEIVRQLGEGISQIEGSLSAQMGEKGRDTLASLRTYLEELQLSCGS